MEVFGLSLLLSPEDPGPYNPPVYMWRTWSRKTHLLNALGNEILKKNLNKRV